MRLAVYSDATQEVGGAEQSLGNLLEFLGPHIDVTVLGVEPSVVEMLAARRPGAQATVLPRVRDKRDVKPFVAHVRTVRALRPEIFQANLPNLTACQYGILAALGTPGVHAIAVEQSPLPISSQPQLRFKRLTSRRLEAHVAVGEFSARATEQIVGLPAGSVRTIYNGVPDVRVAALPLTRPRPLIGVLGRLSREKGHDVLVQALPQLPAATAVFVGDGKERAALERLAAELGVADRLLVTGWTAEARRYIKSVDVVAVPSRFEGFPLVVPEAMLAKRAVVASDVGSVSEAVLEGKSGLLVPPDDPSALASALARLIDDPSLRRSMGRRGRALALERFTAPQMARAFEELYDEVLR